MRLLDRYEEIVGHQEVERLRRLAERLAGKRIVHVNSTRSGGGVAEILGWMVPLHGRVGDRRPLGSDRRTARLLSRHQGLSQRLAGPAGIAQEERLRSALRGQSGERRAAEPGGGHRLRARSAADLPAAIHAAGTGGPLDLALPHRRLAPESRHVEVPGDGRLPLRRGDLLDARLRPAAGLSDVPDLAFDRSAVGQELRDSRGGAAGDAVPAGHRPGAAAVAAGLAVRSLQGPVGRDRGLSPAEALLPGNAIGLGRRTGGRRSGRGRGPPRGPSIGRATTPT